MQDSLTEKDLNTELLLAVDCLYQYNELIIDYYSIINYTELLIEQLHNEDKRKCFRFIMKNKAFTRSELYGTIQVTKNQLQPFLKWLEDEKILSKHSKIHTKSVGPPPFIYTVRGASNEDVREAKRRYFELYVPDTQTQLVYRNFEDIMDHLLESKKTLYHRPDIVHAIKMFNGEYDEEICVEVIRELHDNGKEVSL